MINKLKTQLISVSLFECDLPSIWINKATAHATAASKISQPATEAGKYNKPILLNQIIGREFSG